MRLKTEFICPLCEQVFPTPEQLRLHRLTTHKAAIDEIKYKYVKQPRHRF